MLSLRAAVLLTALLMGEIQRLLTRTEPSRVRTSLTCTHTAMFLQIQPATHLYVQDRYGWYHNARSIATQCRYHISETPSFLLFGVTYGSCHVQRQAGVYTLTVVIKELLYEGTQEVLTRVPMTCSTGMLSDAPVIGESAGKSGHGGAPLFLKSCSKSGFNITISQYATAPPLDLSSVQVEGNQSESCLPKQHSDQSVVFRFPFSGCGVQSQVLDGNVTFWVNILAKKNHYSKKGSLLREAPLSVTVSCSFALFNTSSTISTAVKSAVKNEGVLRAQIRYATDSSFRTFYKNQEHPVMSVLGEPVFVEIFVLKREDKDLVLLLNDCWATPSDDPEDEYRWNLLHQGCPQQGANYSVELIDVQPDKDIKYPKLHKRMKMKMFSFLETEDFFYDSVYLHCDAEVCKGASCQRTCN